MDPLASIANAMEASVANVVIMEALPPHQRRLFRPVARGGVGGVPTPPSGINDIHNFNYLIQERPFDCF